MLKRKINIILIALMLVIFTPGKAKSGVSSNGDHVRYKEIAEIALSHCKNAKEKFSDPKLIWSIIEIEKKYGVPPSMRGMLLASACMESGYNPGAEGDHKFSKKKEAQGYRLISDVVLVGI